MKNKDILEEDKGGAYVSAKSLQSCSTLCDPMDYSPPGSSVHGILQARSSHSLLQGFFPTQGLNPGLMHCGQILYCLSLQGIPHLYGI